MAAASASTATTAAAVPRPTELFYSKLNPLLKERVALILLGVCDILTLFQHSADFADFILHMDTYAVCLDSGQWASCENRELCFYHKLALMM